MTIAQDRADLYQAQTGDAKTTGRGNDQFSCSSGWGLATGIIDLYNGTASLDGGPETVIDDYSVTGQRDPASTSWNAALDSADTITF